MHAVLGASVYNYTNAQFLAAFAKLRKATVSFVMCVRPSVSLSVHMERLGSHRTDSYQIDI
jgi:hypothetical protein